MLPPLNENLLPDLLGGPVLRWGIAGPGRIAGEFVQALLAHTDQQVVAVGSRSQERADRFAREHGIERSWSSYDALVGDPGVDIVYVAVPNSAHREVAELALHAGRHVLVEKPMAADAAEAADLARTAASARRFLMEGMWSRFLPHIAMLEQILAQETLGPLREVVADFGECFDASVERSVFDPAMAGGALRDVGVYPLWLARFVLGTPVSVDATGRLTDTGVDGESELRLRFRGGTRATVTTSVFQATPSKATISGSAGHLVMDGPFLMPGGLTITTTDGTDRWEDPYPLRGLSGLAWEAAAVARDVADGHLESPLHPLSATIGLASTGDAARAQLGAP